MRLVSQSVSFKAQAVSLAVVIMYGLACLLASPAFAQDNNPFNDFKPKCNLSNATIPSIADMIGEFLGVAPGLVALVILGCALGLIVFALTDKAGRFVRAMAIAVGGMFILVLAPKVLYAVFGAWC